MTQSFDEWYRDTRYITAEVGWKAGAQSRQAEISKHEQRRIELANDKKELIKTINELQKRIDEALVQINIYYDSDGMEDICLSDIAEILKGAIK